MWSQGRDANEHGEPVLLLQPVGDRRDGGRRHKGTGSQTPSSSHIGGLPCHHTNDALLSSTAKTTAAEYANPKCAKCTQPMYLLIQLHAPLDAVDRTLYVYGCNDASCYSGKSAKDGDADDGPTIDRFHACIGTDGNGGPLRCYRSQQRWEASSEETTTPKAASTPGAPINTTLESNDWGMDDGSDGWGDDADDWGGGETGSTTMNDLENLLTKCEMKSSAKQEQSFTTNSASVPTDNAKESTPDDVSEQGTIPSFKQYSLEMINEPPTGSGGGDSDEDDNDDDAGCANYDSTKVQQMLSRYLDMEEDEDILSALKGGGSKNDNGSGNEGGGGERYERLPPGERAFLAFTYRLKRVPGQVARYAYGGEPLWSVPLPPRHSTRQHRAKSKKKPPKSYSPMPAVPDCVCGAKRVFEMQLLPFLLHALDVDSYANRDAQREGGDVLDLISTGGMNWGSLAVYSCSESCEKSREEFVIYQDSCFDEQVKKEGVAKGDGDDTTNGMEE